MLPTSNFRHYTPSINILLKLMGTHARAHISIVKVQNTASNYDISIKWTDHVRTHNVGTKVAKAALRAKVKSILIDFGESPKIFETQFIPDGYCKALLKLLSLWINIPSLLKTPLCKSTCRESERKLFWKHVDLFSKTPFCRHGSPVTFSQKHRHKIPPKGQFNIQARVMYSGNT